MIEFVYVILVMLFEISRIRVGVGFVISLLLGFLLGVFPVYGQELSGVRSSAAALPFEKNIGQYDEQVDFLVRTFAGDVAVTEDGFKYGLLGDNKQPFVVSEFLLGTDGLPLTIDMNEGAESVTTVHRFTGSDASQWIRNIPVFTSVQGTPYSLIDLTLEARQDSVEKIFTIHPGARFADIRLGFDQGELQIDEVSGDLILTLETNSLRFRAPYAWQVDTDGNEEAVDVSYYVGADGRSYGFAVGVYDLSRTLYIDPLLKATYVGGNNNDYLVTTAEDEDGFLYFAGSTFSSNFFTTDGTTYDGNSDVIVQKWSNDLSTLLVSTVYGGTQTDVGARINIDSNGNVFIGGGTSSTDFPYTVGGAPLGGVVRHFVTKFSNDLSTIIASRVFDTNQPGNVGGLEINSADEIYIAGNSTNLAGQLAATVSIGTGNRYIYIAKLSNDLSTVMDVIRVTGDRMFSDGIELTSDEDVMVVYQSAQAGFPYTTGSAYSGGFDLVVARFSGDLTTLETGRYYAPNGTASDLMSDVQIDSTDNLFVDVVNESSSTNHQLVKFDSTFNVVWSVPTSNYVNSASSGTQGHSGGRRNLTIDHSDNPILGSFRSSGVATPTDGTSYSGGTDFTITKFSGLNGDVLNFGVMGGSGNDERIYPWVDSRNRIIFAGHTFSTNFPVTDSTVYSASIDSIVGIFGFPLEVTDTVELRAFVSEALIMTLDAIGVSLEADPSVSNGQYLAGQSTVTVASNALSGYVVQARLDDGDGNAQLKSSSGVVIPATIGAGDNYFGYTARNDGIGAAVTAEQDFSASSSVLLDGSGNPLGLNTTTDEQQHTINYDLNVNFLTPAGVYSGTIYYTVVAGF